MAVIGDVNSAKSNLLYHIIGELKKEGTFKLFTYGLRNEICNYLKENYPETTIVGKGWDKETKTPEVDWHQQKMKDINDCNADFVLCLENSMMKNYITEKIHDGFSSDRVVLYLGNPDIEDYVPSNCFINLNDYFNKEMKLIEKL